MLRIIPPGPYDPTYNLKRIAKELDKIPNCGFGRINIYGLEKYLEKYKWASSEKRIYLYIELVFCEFKGLFNQLNKESHNRELHTAVTVVYEELKEMLFFFIADYKKDISSEEKFFFRRIEWVKYCRELITTYSFQFGGLNDFDRAIKDFLYDNFDNILSINKRDKIIVEADDISKSSNSSENKLTEDETTIQSKVPENSNFKFPRKKYPVALMTLYASYIGLPSYTLKGFAEWKDKLNIQASANTMYQTHCDFQKDENFKKKQLGKHAHILLNMLSGNEKALTKYNEDIGRINFIKL